MANSIAMTLFNVVLVEPEIPANAGNIGRTCVGLNCALHFVGKLGFDLSDKHMKRAGLDYWKDLKLVHHASWADWWVHVEDSRRVFFLSTKAKQPYDGAVFQRGDWLVFGKETQGLPEAILQQYSQQAFTIPMPGPIRSLNLSNAVAIVAFEGFRQLRARHFLNTL